MTFVPKPIPESISYENLTRVMNANFELLSLSLKEVDDNLRVLFTRTSKENLNDTVETFQTLKLGTQATTGTPVVVAGWAAATSRNKGIAPCTVNSGLGEITLVKSGFYSFSCWMEGENTTVNPTQLILQMQQDTGAGFGNTLGASDNQFARLDATQDTGSTQFNGFTKNFSAGDKVRFMISDVGDSLNINSDKARISIFYLGL